MQYKNEILYDIYTILMSKKIYDMDHMRISDIEPSALILSQTKNSKWLNMWCLNNDKTL